jgi:hypothetical protein
VASGRLGLGPRAVAPRSAPCLGSRLVGRHGHSPTEPQLETFAYSNAPRGPIYKYPSWMGMESAAAAIGQDWKVIADGETIAAFLVRLGSAFSGQPRGDDGLGNGVC